jgi:hypothetical protein
MSRPVLLHEAQKFKHENIIKVLTLPPDFMTSIEEFLKVLSEMNIISFWSKCLILLLSFLAFVLPYNASLSSILTPLAQKIKS